MSSIIEIYSELITKALLINFDDKDIKNLSNTSLEDVIYNIDTLLDNDPNFFSLSSMDDINFVEKAYDMIDLYRKNSDVDVKFCNNLIRKINSASRYPEKQLKNIRIDYIVKQQEDRDVLFSSLDSMFHAISYDSVVFLGLVENKIDDLSDSNGVVSSIAYFINNYDEMFEDKKIRENALSIIKEAKKDSFHIPGLKKETKKLTKILKIKK